MMKNFSKIMFLAMLMIGSLVSISTNSWVSSWLGLEINLISLIALIIYSKKILSVEASLIYFIVQAMASTIFLYAVIVYMCYSSMNFYYLETFNYLIMFSLMIKLGAAPMHFWLPLVMTNISWINNYLMMTWQKLAPMVLLFYCNKFNNNLMMMFIILSSIIGSVGGFNQVNLKKIMAYSSINYISWLLISMTININLWKMFFMFYFYLTICLVLIFNLFNLSYLSQLFFINNKNLKVKFFIFMNIFSMGGLPPFIGFFPKLLVIMYLINNKNYLMIFIMVMFNLITLYYYLRICYSTFLINSMKNKLLNNSFMMNLKSKKTNMMFKLMMMISFFTNILLMIIIIMNFTLM